MVLLSCPSYIYHLHILLDLQNLQIEHGWMKRRKCEMKASMRQKVDQTRPDQILPQAQSYNHLLLNWWNLIDWNGEMNFLWFELIKSFCPWKLYIRQAGRQPGRQALNLRNGWCRPSLDVCCLCCLGIVTLYYVPLYFFPSILFSLVDIFASLLPDIL